MVVTIHSAEGLKNVKHISAMNPYVIVGIMNNDVNSKSVRTITKVNGGSNPVWEKVIEFVVTRDPSMLTSYQLVCDIKHEGKLGDRCIGQVKVPFEHFLNGDAIGHMIRYPVVRSNGKTKGTIIISHEIKEKMIGIPNPNSIQLIEMVNVDGEVSSPTTQESKGGKKLKYVVMVSELVENCVSTVNNTIQIFS